MIAQSPPDPTSPPPASGVPSCVASLFHYAVLGAILPLLPLLLLRSMGLNWLATGAALALFPAAGLISPMVHRRARALGLSPADGFVVGHLGAAGMSMGFVMWWDARGFGPLDWRVVVPWLSAYAVLLTPTLRWHSEMTSQPNPDASESIAWRLWGAVGFLMPAWFSEGVLAHFEEYQFAVTSHQILPALAGWLGLAAGGAALLFRNDFGSGAPEPDESRPPMGPGFLLGTGVGLVIALQRAHWVWTAPFYSVALQSHQSAVPIVHRLIAVSQVFEIAALASLGFWLSRLGPKKLLVATAGLWIVRSALFGWVSQTDLSGTAQLGLLFAGQALQGIALAGFLGALGAVLLPDARPGGARSLSALIGIAGMVGCVVAGCLTAVLAGQIDSRLPGELPRQFDAGVLTLQLGGWGGIWWYATLPAVAAVLTLCIVPIPKPQSAQMLAEHGLNSASQREREHVPS